MSARKNLPPVTGRTGRERFIELLKDLLIVALICSGAFLVSQTRLTRHFEGLVPPLAQGTASTGPDESYSLVPLGIAVRNDMGLYGASYDESAVSRTFARFSTLFGEAFATVGETESITRYQWQNLLESPGVYCALQGAPALEALWDLPDGGPEGRAEAVLLVRMGSRIWLGWRDGDSFFRAKALSVYENSLTAALDEFRPNGASYAYTLAWSDEAYSDLDPYTLVAGGAPQPQAYLGASPDLTDAGELGKLLGALDFVSGPEAAYETAEGLTVAENGDRLQVTAGGEVSFRAGEETRFPVGVERAGGSTGEAVQRAWELLERCVSPWMDAGSFALTGAESGEEGLEVTFQARLDGIPVLMSGDGTCARFVIRNGKVQAFNLSLRTYTATGETTVLPGDRLAAAALRSIPGTNGKMTLCYSDNGGTVLTAGWVAGE